MSKIITKLCNIMPFQNKFKNILLFLFLSPFVHNIMSYIYCYNCTTPINNIYDIIYIMNPFKTPNPLCLLLVTIIGANLYIVQYIHYVAIMFIVALILL